MTDALRETNDQLAQLLGERRLFIEKCIEALRECADDLEAEIINRNPSRAGEQEIMKRRRDRDLQPVNNARALISEFEKKGAGE